MLPVTLDVAGRLAVVVGAGPVGLRKARALLAAGARVRVVSPDPPAEFPAEEIEWIWAPYEPGQLAGAALVFAAGPAELNRQVVEDARARGLWVNSASEPAQGDFFLPAVVRRGPLTVAISTAGHAPALAAALRQRLEEELDDALADWVALLAELRPLVLAEVAEEHRRAEVFAELARWDWLDRLRTEGRERVEERMRALIRG